MKKILKQKKGITLIALVITIIVLLILAGISISMLSGDNSILQKATESKKWTERSKIIETAQMDILGKQAENHGSLSEQELIDILTSNDYNTKGTLLDNNEESVLQKTLTSNNGKYQIPVSEIYNGTLTNANSNTPTEYSNEVKTALAEGTYVTYKNKPYVVLYNDANGIEIISMELMGTVTLGADDEAEGAQGTKSEFSRAQWSYNNAIQTLNKAAENLITSDGIVDDARCVGSVPGKTSGISNKNTRISTPYVEGVFGDFDVKFEQGEELCENESTRLEDNRNYTTDLNKLTELGIANINEDYFLASRFILTSFPPEFGISTIQANGTISDLPLGDIFATDYVEVYSQEIGIRPIFHLSKNVKIKTNGGNGSSANPFVLE